MNLSGYEPDQIWLVAIMYALYLNTVAWFVMRWKVTVKELFAISE